MLRFPSGIENSGNLSFSTSILHVLLNQQVFRKAFACFVNLHKECQDCELGETHHTRHLSTGKTHYTETHTCPYVHIQESVPLLQLVIWRGLHL